LNLLLHHRALDLRQQILFKILRLEISLRPEVEINFTGHKNIPEK